MVWSKVFFIYITCISLTLGSVCQAMEAGADPDLNQYFDKGSTKMRVSPSQKFQGNPPKGTQSPISNPWMSRSTTGVPVADILFNIWNVMASNPAEVEAENLYATALPPNEEDNWESRLQGMPEESLDIDFSHKNPGKITVIRFHVGVKVNVGSYGSKRRKGYYINSLQVLPVGKASWAHHLKIHSAIAETKNVGTKKKPIAAMTIVINYEYGNIFWIDQGVMRILVQGDGLIQDLESGKIFYPAQSKKQKQRLN